MAIELQTIEGQDAIALDMPMLMAYQTVAQHQSSLLKVNRTGHMSGAYLSKLKGRGMEFDEARHYQAGDDIRAIDWRVTARTGKAHTKVFREERERPVFMLCDVSATMQFGSSLQLKSVLAGHITALLAWRAKHLGDRVGGMVFNSLQHVEIKPTSRTTTLLHLLQQCCTLQQNQPLQYQRDKDSFNDALKRMNYLAKPGAQVNLISDFHHLDNVSQGLLQNLRRRCDLRCFVIEDPFETAQLKHPIQLKVTDGLTVAERTFGLASEKTESPKRQLQQLGLGAITVDTSATLIGQLPNIYRQLGGQ